MKVALSVIGRFHSFDLARELHARGALQAIYTGYPRFKLSHEGVPQELIHTFPYVQAPYMAFRQRERLGQRLVRAWERLAYTSLDAYVGRRLQRAAPCDVFVALSGVGLRSGRVARRLGARHVCDRGSSHIREQERLLREEHEIWNVPFAGIDPRVIEREETEYEEADCITVPSTFAWRSFVERGIAPSRVRMLPYGVDLRRFGRAAAPAENRFDVLFVGGMSLRKGVPYLLQAYRALRHPRKSLTFAGAPSDALMQRWRRCGLWPDDARVLGHVPQAELKGLMSCSHAMVLPSIEEGLALVQAQAMACGCVVVGTGHTGAEDLIADGEDGFVVPIRDAAAIAERLQRLADHPHERVAMGMKAMQRVQRVGGWSQYADRAMGVYAELIR